MAEEIDPTEFVQRIRQLGEQRDQQDAERVKKLEEDLIQGRSERLARRAERARSISPEKPTPIMSPPLPLQDQPQDHVAGEESLQQLPGSSAPPSLDDTEPKKPAATSAAALGRSGTLSWKQRPHSGSMRRPLSSMAMAATSPADRARSTSPTKASEPSSPPSRSSIAASLAAKDAAYFGQTPDRGVGSAAYRRSQDDSTASDAGSTSARKPPPGMSRESTIEPELVSPPPQSTRSSSPGSRGGSFRGSALITNRFSTNTSISGGDAESITKMRSPLPVLDSQKFAPPSEQPPSADSGDAANATRGLAMSPTQGRISPERDRPASPTKGMGGFVQSAMLKRSDSVSKRWSTQTPQGLTRQNSSLSNRGSAMAGYGSLSRADRPSSLSRDNSIEPSSRPTSSHSNATTITKDVDRERAPRDEFVKPALPYHSRSKSVASTFSEKDQHQDESEAPASPSKRWSPTKSSWLESALNKPDSPKPKQPPPAQPAWMAEINRIKQQRSSVDLGKGNPPLGSSGDVFTTSGRTSPIKDIQLKPAALRKFDTPKQDLDAGKSEKPAGFRKFDVPAKNASAEPEQGAARAEPSPRLKPTLSPKPSLDAKEDSKPAEETNPVQEDQPVGKSAPAKEEPVSAATKATTPEPSKVAARSAAAAKIVPDTPPKKDFRAGLKPRQPINNDASHSGQVSELQNVFGKLRKAETKNYVAPDVLKSNILQGKNALNVTGGPKPNARRDEFRDSLVRKKSAILEKAQETGSVLKKSDSISQPGPTPEAIAKRGALGRSDSGPKPESSEKPKDATPEALARQKSLRAKKSFVDDKPVLPAPSFTPKEPVKTGKLVDRFNPALAGILARGPPALTTTKSTSSADGTGSPVRSTQEAKPGPAPELQHATKSRARGPKRRAPAANKTTVEAVRTQPEKALSDVAAVPLVKPEHVLPSSHPSKANGPPEETAATKTPARQSLVEKPATPAKSARIASGQFAKSTPEPSKKPASLEQESKASASQDTPKKSPRPESIASPKLSSPDVPKKPASLESDRRISGSQSTPQKSPLPQSNRDEKAASSAPSPAPLHSRFSRPLPAPPISESPKPIVLKEIAAPNVEISPVKDEDAPESSTFSSVKSATKLWGRQSAPLSPAPLRIKSPIKLPTKADEQTAMEDAGLVRTPGPVIAAPSQPKSPMPHDNKPLPPKPKPAGLGFSLSSLGGYLPARSRESTPERAVKDLPTSPPASAGRPQSEPFKGPPPPAKAEGMFAEFFDETPVTEDKLPENIDAVHVLRSPPLDLGPMGKIRTLRKQIQEVTGDGKLASIPVQEEHILFQDSMYLCTHVYEDAKGAKHTDVYLWAGNGVADPTIEDVQLFAKNHAKQSQGRLLTIRQGQETPNFFEALGGIVITRRGTKPASKEFMLCGRRHVGHLAFDEVDFALKSLCSAFPYLMSSATGKVYLWKGRGCSAEELSGARLMGMDLAPTGDFTEIDESAEPQDFIETFPAPAVPTKGPAIPRSADHWRYKATSDKYRARLYKIEQTQAVGGWGQALQTPITPKTPSTVSINVKEIMPFCQRDLEPENVYVLDAFFEMYIIIGALSRTQSQAFSTALVFAQEYGILAVSEEDRPFMPVTTVVMEGVPRDMKAVFRHWDDALIPAAGLMRGKLGRGKSLRIVGLEKAIEATRR